ncbi:hypothetical protein J3F83DRAFT_673592 [Trichoderma novae-zelandiae]
MCESLLVRKAAAYQCVCMLAWCCNASTWLQQARYEGHSRPSYAQKSCAIPTATTRDFAVICWRGRMCTGRVLAGPKWYWYAACLADTCTASTSFTDKPSAVSLPFDSLTSSRRCVHHHPHRVRPASSISSTSCPSSRPRRRSTFLCRSFLGNLALQ